VAIGSPGSRPARHHQVIAGPPFKVASLTLRLVDASRTIRLPGGGAEPRILLTYVRYPGSRSAGPFPLIVFGHGFTKTPAPYAQLLDAWARAGYVVAAPVFPLENANAPGGPNEADLINQPRDMSFVITRLLGLSSRSAGTLSYLIDPRAIAVAGHSDGGDTALTASYDSRFRDRRIRAAVILSGAEIPGLGGFDFTHGGPALLATQGTADTINLPSATYAFFDPAPRPKFLLRLFGAQHLGPYTGQEPQLGIVERVSIAFLDRYLKQTRVSARTLLAAGHVPGVAALTADP
jgi:dienelactone hydrolase